MSWFCGQAHAHPGVPDPDMDAALTRLGRAVDQANTSLGLLGETFAGGVSGDACGLTAEEAVDVASRGVAELRASWFEPLIEFASGRPSWAQQQQVAALAGLATDAAISATAELSICGSDPTACGAEPTAKKVPCPPCLNPDLQACALACCIYRACGAGPAGFGCAGGAAACGLGWWIWKQIYEYPVGPMFVASLDVPPSEPGMLLPGLASGVLRADGDGEVALEVGLYSLRDASLVDPYEGTVKFFAAPASVDFDLLKVEWDFVGWGEFDATSATWKLSVPETALPSEAVLRAKFTDSSGVQNVLAGFAGGEVVRQ